MHTRTKDLMLFAAYAILLSTMFITGRMWAEGIYSVNLTVPATSRDFCGYTPETKTKTVTYTKSVKSKDLRAEYLCMNGSIYVVILRNYYE